MTTQTFRLRPNAVGDASLVYAMYLTDLDSLHAASDWLDSYGVASRIIETRRKIRMYFETADGEQHATPMCWIVRTPERFQLMGRAAFTRTYQSADLGAACKDDLAQLESMLCRWAEYDGRGEQVCAVHLRSKDTSLDGVYCDGGIGLEIVADAVATFRVWQDRIRTIAQADLKCPCCTGYAGILQLLDGEPE